VTDSKAQEEDQYKICPRFAPAARNNKIKVALFILKYQHTVLLRPFVHSMSPVTSKVHWIRSSFLGNHAKITINGNPAKAGAKILTFFSLIGPRKFNVTVTRGKLVHVTTLRHPSPE
jgi:hypothetical protein